MKKLFLCISLVVLSQVKAQIDPVKYPTFTNIEDALKSKKAVYSMSFREKDYLIFHLRS
jgi:hypothetical protein